MAGTTTADTRDREPRDFAPDLVGVKSRVSWGAILAGAVIGLATLMVLSLLFGAIGVSVADAGVRGQNVAIGVLIALFVAVIVSMFLAGWVASQLTVGENRQEAALYGLLTWAAVVALSMALAGSGVKAGYFAVVGGGALAQNAAQNNPRVPTFEESMRQLGYTDQQAANIKTQFTPAAVREAAANPENQEAARDAAMYASWTALVAVMLSLGACVGGALVGCGTVFRLFPVVRVRDNTTGPRLIVPTT